MPSPRDTLITPDELKSKPSPLDSSSAMLEALESELRENIGGEVRFDPGTKAMYAVDASNYRQVPIGVVIPKSKEDVVQTVAACRRYGIPLLSRGGGTSLAGQCCNVAIVIDWSKYMHGVLEVNTSERWARVLPGTVCDELRNRVMKDSDNLLTWGPDPATHTHCCFGGMIGNNSCGAHAQMSGKTDANIEELEVLLYDGTRMTLGWMTEAELDENIRKGGRTGDIFRHLKSLRDLYADLIREKYPPIPRRVSGYNLDQLLPSEDGRFNLARALVGSEGTLVTILEAKCRLIDAKAERVILMLGYPDAYEAADHVVDINPFKPTALEGIDHHLYQNIEKKGGPHRRFLGMLPEGKGWLMAEFGAEKREDAEEIAQRVMESLKGKPGMPSMRLFTDKEEMARLWEVRESGLGATAFVPGNPDTWPGWEDSAVAPEKLGSYLRDLRALFQKYEYNPALYGHFGHGCVHCHVDFNVTTEAGIKKWRSFMEEATDLCVRYGGSLSGEHGDGQARGEFLNKMFGEELIQAFREFKSIWDPDWKMNPGKVVAAHRMDENLRLGAGYNPPEAETHFKWPEDGGSFAHAALRCIGIGKCRRQNGKKAEDDTMCPSFMVTHEERHTTRGRAHHLWEMLHGDVIANGWRDESVKEALDLCLACKGCKGDCPVNVDMATYKAEFLSHYWEGRLRPRHAYAFGLIDQWARLASLAPGFVNLVTQLPGLSALAKIIAGMPQARQIPAFAPETFKSWFRKREAPNVGQSKVILWADTFNNHFFPETAQAATEVLEHFGYQVQVPMEDLCCGRPLYDYGFLDRAKQYLNNILETLADDIADGTPMVVLEPSCCSVFRDELNGLMPESRLAHRLMENTFTLSEFLEKKVKNYTPPTLRRKAIVQGHCHHKAIMRMYDDEAVMRKMGLDFELLNTGCCGMAGSFGFENDKYEVSQKCGERALFPAVRKAGPSTLVMADGFSCREQIQQDTPRHALHLAEVMRLALDEEKGVRQMYPEAELVKKRTDAQHRSMMRAGIISGLVIAGGALLLWGATGWLGGRRSWRATT
ncbi:MAG TPA: FAD-binding and (Fe-S)-binding domain-containing protein [Terriglobales bacterium]|nr:FAD-binding and (Fe-S)-binding domain-containing protein [Terriglobales bacterium]